jgi:hypothetical protein
MPSEPPDVQALADRLARAVALAMEADTRASGLALRLAVLETAIRTYVHERNLGHDDMTVLTDALAKVSA